MDRSIQPSLRTTRLQTLMITPPLQNDNWNQISTLKNDDYFIFFLPLIKIVLNQIVEFSLSTNEILSQWEMLTGIPSLVTDSRDPLLELSRWGRIYWPHNANQSASLENGWGFLCNLELKELSTLTFKIYPVCLWPYHLEHTPSCLKST